MNKILSKEVSFELAELLKEKGFAELCSHCYHDFLKEGEDIKKPLLREFTQRKFQNSNITKHKAAPTIGEVLDWIFEKYNIWLWVEQEDTTNKFEWLCRYEDKGACKDYDDKFYTTPLEAYEEAIKYVLKIRYKNGNNKR